MRFPSSLLDTPRGRFLIAHAGDQKTLDDVAWEIAHDFFSTSRITPSADDVFLVLGAAEGAHVIDLALRFRDCRIVAVEPDPDLFKLLERNITQAGVRNVDMYCGWLTDDGRPPVSFRPSGRPLRRIMSLQCAEDAFGPYAASDTPALDVNALHQGLAGNVCFALINLPGAEPQAIELAEKLGDELYICGGSAHFADWPRMESLLDSARCHYFWRFFDAHDRILAPGGRCDCKISVIVPIYNVQDYLPTCLDSLLETKELRAEFICVNDGSTDGSLNVLRKYADRDARIKILDKPNGGCASARNAGLDKAKGEYVGFLDSDDWIDAGFFDALLACAHEKGTDVVQGGLTKEYLSDGIAMTVDEEDLEFAVDKNMVIVDRSVLYPVQPTIWRRIYRRSMLNGHNIRFYESLPRFDDLPFQFEVHALADSMSFVPDKRYHYRLQRVGQDVEADDERLFVHFEIFDLLRKSLERRNAGHAMEGLRSVTRNTHRWALSKLREDLVSEYREEATKRGAEL